MADNITYAEMNLSTGKGKGQEKANTAHLKDEDPGVTYAAVKKPRGKKKEKSSKQKVSDPPQSEGVSVTYAAINKKTKPKPYQPDSAGGEDTTVTYAALRGTSNKNTGQGEEKSPWDTSVIVSGDKDHADCRERLYPGRCRSLVLVPSLVILCLVLLITTIIIKVSCMTNTHENGTSAAETSRGWNSSWPSEPKGEETTPSRVNITASSSPCPDPWILLTNKCYYFSENKKSQKESREDCETRNSTLATVTGGMILRLVTLTAQEFWIGLESRGTHHNNGVWSGRWGDGSVVNVTKGSGTCAKMGRDLSLSNCHQALHWICERDVPTT